LALAQITARWRNSLKTFQAFQAKCAKLGQDDGGPGLRPQYHPDYYAAFVVDSNGHRIEAVCHAPERAMIV
jgi:hypothetical protein